MIKVLVDCAPLSVGGGVQVATALLMNLQATREVEWRAVVPDLLRPMMVPDLLGDPRVVFLRKRSRLDILSLRRHLRAAERAFAPDVVFTVFGPSYFRPRAPHVVGFALPLLIYDPDCPETQKTALSWILDRLGAALLRQADHLLVETETVRQRLAARLNVDPCVISVIGNSVNPLLLKERPTDAPANDRFLILIPSAYYRHKNLEIVPAVAAALRRMEPTLDFEFQLTLPERGAPWRAIQVEARRLGVGYRVRTLGPLPLTELAEAYRGASAVFLPTLREASTAVYPEAFYMRRPIVTSDMDFARALCGAAALFAPPHDAQQLAAALVLLARTPELRGELVASGQRQLSIMYPAAREKFHKQLDVLRNAACA